MGAEFIFSVISTLSGLLTSLRSSGATSTEGEEKEEEEATSSSSADGRMMKKMKRSEGVISGKMAEKIKGVIDRFDEISRDRDALCLREDDGDRRDCVWTGLLPTSHMVNETAVFGRDEDKRRILDFVLDFVLTLVNCCKSDSPYMVIKNNLKLCTSANLRVLKYEGAYEHALEHMVNLKHLRYFELSCNNLERLPKSTTLLFNLVALRISFLGCLKELPVHIGKLVNLSLEGILNRSSLNISIEKKQVKRNLDIYKYRKSESLLECLKPLNHLVELKVNGFEGIGYPKWIGTNYNSGVAIFMQCHLNSGKFFRDLGELPSLKSLALIGQTLANDFFQTLTTQDVKMIFPSLEELEFKDMIEWDILVGEQHWGFPVLHSLRINNCPNLSSVPKFDSLKRLEIIKCSFSKLEINMLHLQLLQSLHIEECIQLTSLHGLQSLRSLRTLYVVRCPRLKEIPYPRIRDRPISINIVDCPHLKSWCQRHLLKYVEDSSCRMLVTSGHGNQNTMHERDQEILPAHPLIENYIEQSLEFHKGLYNLEKLEIKHCRELETLKGLREFRWLRRLVLWDCPLLRLEQVPPFLISLVVHGCHNMLSLDLLQPENPTFLTELEITKYDEME
ncbi:putative disease resistance RPP13-like protein 1-like isoform X1 [Carex littledalei]|uniref:Putative disease resistance RPP13-like protein 1-like isoform X1 n=1 Tax=Carex littledalei TaxID=544730 RepID=A0A833RNI4_9POAL|nr:putative disease resistance RPP13-like protein 1-like isoform X1 [Carex littledalei]